MGMVNRKGVFELGKGITEGGQVLWEINLFVAVEKIDWFKAYLCQNNHNNKTCSDTGSDTDSLAKSKYF